MSDLQLPAEWYGKKIAIHYVDKPSERWDVTLQHSSSAGVLLEGPHGVWFVPWHVILTIGIIQ